MKEKILKLRDEGKTYTEIQNILGCSKGTISYHCGEGQKKKYLNRQRKNRKTIKSKIKSKLDSFCRNKIRNYKRGSNPNNKTNSNINYDSAYKKLINSPKCYLTGKEINLGDVFSYQLDHIVPTSKGGKNTLKNMGLTIVNANRAKSDMLLEDFVDLCKSVVINNGYKLIKQ